MTSFGHRVYVCFWPKADVPLTTLNVPLSGIKRTLFGCAETLFGRAEMLLTQLLNHNFLKPPCASVVRKRLGRASPIPLAPNLPYALQCTNCFRTGPLLHRCGHRRTYRSVPYFLSPGF